MDKIVLKKSSAKRIATGYPLIVAEDLTRKSAVMDKYVRLVDERNSFIGVGYVSQQNKGLGWLLSLLDKEIGQSFFSEKLRLAKSLRLHFFADERTNAFRLFNGEGDGIGGLTIDFYAGFAVFSWYNTFIYQQKELILDTFREVFPEIIGGYEKIRFEGMAFESRHIFGEIATVPLIVKENGVNYATYLDEGLMTGIFLDQKNVRALLSEELAVGKSILNMFSYTGAFSVASAFGGALETTSVDLAKRSLSKTREQFEVNGINADKQKIYVMDVFGYFKYAKKKGLSYDLIVLDPPSFARNKKQTFSVAKNYGELIEESVDILHSFGVIIASTNAANVSREKFRQMVELALKKKKVRFEVFHEEHLPDDFHVAKEFTEGDYLKVLFIEVRK